MEVQINKKFLKDLAKIPVNDRVKIEKFVFEESGKIPSIETAGIFEKLKDTRLIYYRVRFGNCWSELRKRCAYLSTSPSSKRYISLFSVKRKHGVPRTVYSKAHTSPASGSRLPSQFSVVYL